VTFLEAVEALQSGECEGIRAAGWNSDNVLFVSGGKLQFRQGLAYIPYAVDFSKQFQPVNPIPRTEKREVKRWFCTECKQSQGFEGSATCCEKPMVPLTGHYDAPVPRKVKRREEISPVMQLKEVKMKHRPSRFQLGASCFILSLVFFSMMWAAPPENVVTTRTVAQVEKAHGLTVAIDRDGEPQSCGVCHG
jgi:hypothetical protein